jgi:hypothetical protein
MLERIAAPPMSWEALNARQLAGLLASLNRVHANLARILRRLERSGISPRDDPLYRRLVEAADAITDARFLLRSRSKRT